MFRVGTGIASRHKVARVILAAGVFAVFASGLTSLLAPRLAVAAPGINKQINFQGKVVNANGTNVTNGNYNFVFRLYTQSTGGTAIWTDTATLTVTDGIFQYELGSDTVNAPLPGSVDFNTDNIYLGVNFNSDGEMLPRIRFTAVPYSFNSDLFDGLDSSDFAQLDPGSAQTGSLNVTGSVTAATSLQSPLVDNAGTLGLGTGTGTTAVTVGRTATSFTIQGNTSSTLTATSGGFTTTVGFAAPTANNSISFPNAGGTICTTVASTCSTTYQAAGSYLAKGAMDASSFAVTATNYLYGFTNSSTAVASGVLKLDNGSNTGSALYVTASGNAGANNALIVANNTAGSPSGNLMDLQVGGASRFAVGADGNVAQNGGSSTTNTINGQRISAAANFTGTVTAATSLAAPLANLTGAASTSIVADVRVTGDTNPRLTIGADGAMKWGSGSGATDITLSRDSSAYLSTSSFRVNNQLIVSTNTNTVVPAVIKGATGQSGDLLRLQNVNDNVLASFSNAGQLTLGRSAASGTNVTGSAAFVDGGNTSGYAATLTVSSNTLTANRTINLPNEAGTVCLQSSTSCGFVTGSANSYIQNQSATAQSANFDIQSAAAGTVTATIRGASGQSTNVLQVVTNGGTQVSVNNVGRLTANATASINNSTSTANPALVVSNSGATTVAAYIQGAASQSANLLEFRNSNGDVLSSHGATGQLTLGRSAASGTNVTGSAAFVDGGNTNGYAATLTVASNTLTGNHTINLPNADGTVCLQSSTSCGFAPSATNGYVQLAPSGAQADSTTNSSIFINKTGASGNILQLQNNGVSRLTVNNAGELQVGNASGTTIAGITTNGLGYFGNSAILGNAVLSANAYGTTQQALYAKTAAANATAPTAILQAGSGQTADLLQLQNNNTNVLASFSNSGQLTLGRSAASGTNVTGSAAFADGGNTNGYAATLTVASNTLTANRTINLPNEGGTICLQSSTSCGFAPSATAYVQGGNSFGAAGDLGTNDNYALNLRANNATRLTVSTAGDLTFATGAGGFDQSGSTGTFKTGTGAVTLNGDTTVAVGKTLGLSAAASSTVLQNFQVTSDTNPRLTFAAGGQLGWGPGNAATDVTLSRTGATAMQGSGTWTFTGGVAVGTPSSQYGKLAVQVSSAANAGIVVRGTTAQSGNLLEAQEVGGSTLASIGANGALTLGRSAASGVSQTGSATLVYGGNTSGYGVTLTPDALTGARTITLDNLSGRAALVQTAGASSAQTGDMNVSGAVYAGASLRSPILDTATGVQLRIADSTATSVLIGNTARNFTLQGAAGVSGSKITATTGANTTTLDFTTPTANRSIHMPDEGGTVCLQNSSNCGFLLGSAGSYIINQTSLQASSNFYISGVGRADTSMVAPLFATTDVTSGTSAAVTVRSGTGTAGGASTGAVTVRSGDANGTGTSGNVRMDVGTKGASGFAGNMYLGDANAANINIGRNAVTASGVTVSIQGLAATSSIIMNNATNTFSTTIGFTAPTASNSILFPNAGGTVCTTTASTCNTTYQPYSANGYLAKAPAATESSSSSIVGNQYSFSNTNGGAAGVLALINSGTNSALSVSAAASPSAGQAVILGSNTLNNATGNMLDLWSTQSAVSASRFAVDMAGNIAQAGGSATVATVNGQRISAAANFTGTVTTANKLTVNTGGLEVVAGGATVTAGGLTVTAGGASIAGGLDNNSGGITEAGAVSGATSLAFTGAEADITGARNVTATGTYTGGGMFRSADSTTANTADVTLKSGDASVGAGLNSGSVTVDSGTHAAAGTSGAVNIGNTNASAVTVGNTNAPFTIQGTAGTSGSKLVFGNTTIDAASSATVATYRFAAPAAATTYTICTSDLTSCGTGSTGYLRKGVIGETSNVNIATAGQYMYNFSNSGGVQSEVLQLDNGAGTGSTLRVRAAASAAANNALLLVENTFDNATGNLLDLRSTQGGTSASRLSVSTTGAITGGTFNGQTISAAASFTGTLGTAGLLTAGSLSVTNSATFNAGATVNNEALTVNAGASVTGGINNNNGDITNAGDISGLTSLQFSSAGTIDANAAVSIGIGTTNASALNIGRSGGTLSLQGNSSSALTVHSGGGNTTSIQFADPTANVIYQFVTAPADTYQICTTYASTCGTTYAAYYANGYVQLDPAAAQTDATANSSIWISRSQAGNFLRLQNGSSDVFTVQTNGTAYVGGSSSSSVMMVDTANFRVRVGTGGTIDTATGTSNANAALYVAGAAEFDGQLVVGGSTNGITTSTSGGNLYEPTLNGTARHIRQVSLAPEYPGAVMTPNGSSNTGLMTSDFCSGASHLGIPTVSNYCAATEEHNYYKWVSVNASAQTYDIYVRYLLPTDFSSFTADNSILMYGYRTTANDRVDLSFIRNDGTICGSATNVATANTTWTETAIVAPLATTCAASFSANQMVTLRIRLTSTGTSNVALAGEIRFDYYSKY